MTDDATQDWPGTETWLCEGCDEPKPTDECWPCETDDDGRLVLCPDCRDERDVEPVVLTDGGDARCGCGTDQYSKADLTVLRARAMSKAEEADTQESEAYHRGRAAVFEALRAGDYDV